MKPAILCAVLMGSAAATTQPLSYADLMKAPPEQRRQLFEGLTPDNRAAVLKQRWEAWLAVHEPDLSGRQIALVREAIVLAAADGSDPATIEKREQMAHRLACALGGDLASTLNGFSELRRLQRSWRQRARDWIDWAVNCVV
jgi:hypothetical protein